MQPDTITKLALMGDAAAYEPVGDQPQQERRRVPYQSHSLEDFEHDLLTMLRWAEEIRRTHPYEKLAGAVTQFVVGAVGDMELALDPKRAWAERHLREAPVEIMTASRAQLLRIPGIGPVGASAIIHARRLGRLTDLSYLRHLNIRSPEQAAPYEQAIVSILS